MVNTKIPQAIGEDALAVTGAPLIALAHAWLYGLDSWVGGIGLPLEKPNASNCQFLLTMDPEVIKNIKLAAIEGHLGVRSDGRGRKAVVEAACVEGKEDVSDGGGRKR
jgi:hypothetical protein